MYAIRCGDVGTTCRPNLVSLVMVAAIFSLVVALGSGFDAKVSSPELLRYASVRQELKLTPQQDADVTRAESDYWAGVKKTGNNNSDVERREVLKYLNGNQLERLREISLQQAGPLVLLADFVADQVGADKTKVQRAFNGMVHDVVKPMQDEISTMANEVMRGAGSDPEKAEVKAREVDAKANAISAKYSDRNEQEIQRRAPSVILAVLTPAQRDAWRSLLGRPFTIPELKSRS